MGINIKEMYKEVDKDEINSEAFLSKILAYFRLRMPFNYGYADIIRYIFCCRCIIHKKYDNEARYHKGS